MARLATLLESDLALTAVVSGIALLAVWVPFFRALRVCLHARAATRRLARGELRGERAGRGRVQPVALLMLRVLRRSLRESRPEAWPGEFLVDAARQYAVNEYETHFARPISMYANLLPPIGFIGTTVGMLILFLSMHLANASLELGALAAALTSSIFALVGFAVLESLKIRLYGRLLACLDQVTAVCEVAIERKAEGPPTARAG